MTNINQHKHIIITGDQVNALGVLRSLAEGNVSPILIYAVESRFRTIVISSKYAKKCHKVSSYEEAEKHDTYGNIVNELCANNSRTFYNRNKLLVFYIKHRNFIRIDSISNDDNKLVVIIKTGAVMAGVTPSNRYVIKLSNSEYKKINEITILIVDEHGNNIESLVL
jgi:hypothetical protein